MRARLREHAAWAAILVLALGVRVVGAVVWQAWLPAGQRFGFPDSESYWELGRSLARGGPYAFGADGFRIFRMPGYPALLAPLFWVWEEPPVLAARIEGALCGTAAVGLVGVLAGQIAGRRAAWLAGVLAAVHPEAVGLSILVLSEAGFTPLMLAQLALWIAACRAGQTRAVWGWSLAGGLAGGLATLMRPSWLLFIPFVGLMGWPLAVRREAHLRIVGGMLVGLVVVLAPWWVRNYWVAGRFVPTTLQVGASLYDGLHPGATGASDMRFLAQFVAAQREEDAQNLARGVPPRGLFEDRLDRRLARAAWEWAWTHPRQVLTLATIKAARMWSLWPHARELQGFWPRLALGLAYPPVMLLAAVACGWAVRQQRDWLLLAAPAVYLTLLHMVFVSSLRYRMPAMLPLMVLAAAALDEGWRFSTCRWTQRSGGARRCA
jgi:4-amino-4-deoxy-L-arabinose transferase-like glycosyltransferase